MNASGSDKLGEIAAEAVNDRESHLAGALKLAEASFPPGKVKTIALVTDGNETLGDASAASSQLNKAGVKVQTFTAAPPDKPEVLIRAVNAPRQVRSEEPFRVEIEVSSNRETDSGDSRLSQWSEGRIAAGASRNPARIGWSSPKPCGVTSGWWSYRPRVKSAQDTIADNNRSSAIVQTEGLSKVLLIADKPEQARYLSWALKQEGIVLDARPATGAPTTLADLQNYDLVILDNVPATSLTIDQMNLLSTYVRDFGGGLLMTGGDQAFGLEVTTALPWKKFFRCVAISRKRKRLQPSA